VKNIAHQWITAAAFNALPPSMREVLDVEPDLVAEA
jgi:hypothetical protein